MRWWERRLRSVCDWVHWRSLFLVCRGAWQGGGYCSPGPCAGAEGALLAQCDAWCPPCPSLLLHGDNGLTLRQRFYRLDVYCKPCPDLAWVLIVGFVVVVTCLLVIGVWLNQRRINLAALGIGIDFAQVPPLPHSPATCG
jgi:hypothetical protein